MRDGWRKLAERAELSAFEPEQIADAIPTALENDWRDERCDDFVRQIESAIGGSDQASLFPLSLEASVEVLKRISGAGYPLRRLLLDTITQAVEDGYSTTEAVANGVARALAVRCAAGARQVEEHYLRKSDETRADNVRSRIEEGASRIDFMATARAFLKLPGASLTATAEIKHDGLDDGVRF